MNPKEDQVMPWRSLPTPSESELRELKSEFRGRVRLLVDENAGPEVTSFLKDGGFNVKYVDDFGLCGRSDEDVFAVAWKEGRVIVTHDRDFLDNRQFPPHRNPGVIVIGPGADGRDDEGLRRCLVLSLMLAGDFASWYVGKKIEFTSGETLTIYGADHSKKKYKWPRGGDAMEWVD
jgi:hypothetical protein